MLAVPKRYSNRLVIRWTPLERMAIRFSYPINMRVNAHADSQVPNPPIPFTGSADVNSAPVIPKMVLEKLKLAKEKP